MSKYTHAVARSEADQVQEETVCGLSTGNEITITYNSIGVTCPDCIALIDGTPPPVSDLGSVWPTSDAGTDPMVRRVIALKEAAAVAPSITGKGKGSPLAPGGTEPPSVIDLLTVAEWLVGGGSAAEEFYSAVYR